MSQLTDKIETELAGVAAECGCEIIRVSLHGMDKKRVLQIMIEREDGSSVTIDDCEKFSKAAAVTLDVIDPIKGFYNLEVSSAGLDRPLCKVKDFERFCGSYVVVKTYTLKGDRKIFKGMLESATENDIRLKLNEPLADGTFVMDFSYDEINHANIDGMKEIEDIKGSK